MGGVWVHRLSHKDFEKRTAFCEHCGWVRIQVKKNGKGGVTARCSKRAMEDKRRYREKQERKA